MADQRFQPGTRSSVLIKSSKNPMGSSAGQVVGRVTEAYQRQEPAISRRVHGSALCGPALINADNTSYRSFSWSN